MLQYKKKYFLTLFEIIISLVLISIILMTLFSFFRKLVVLEKKMETAKQELFNRQHLQLRLDQVFSKIVPSFALQEQSSLYTATFPKEKMESLICIFDNGVDIDPSFSGNILAKIHLEDNNLYLTTWPLKKTTSKKQKFRKELLYQKIALFKPQFFTLSEHPTTHKKTIVWEKSWKKDQNDPPPIIKIKIYTLDKEKLSYAFFLPSKESVISY